MKRNTVQKQIVLESVHQLQNHPTADQVYDRAVEQHPSISRGTVYRNLNQLAEDGEIYKIQVPSGADRFDHMVHPHYHIRCQRCNKLFDVEMAYMEGLEDAVANQQGFRFTGHTILFRGICPQCQVPTDGEAI